jgi:hypothetical protein
MEYSEQQKQEFRSRFAARRRKHYMVTGPFIMMIILFVSAEFTGGLVLGFIPESSFAPYFVLVAMGAFIFSLFNWRCPACNKYIGRGFNPNYCSKCGVGLR